MFENGLHLLFVVTSALAASVLVYWVLVNLVQLAQRLYLRRRPWWLRLRQRSHPSSTPTPLPSNRLSRLAVLAAAGGLAAKAALTGGLLVAVYLVLIGIALYWYLGQYASALSREQTSGGIGELVAAYYSSYLVSPTVFNALSEASKTISHPQLQAAVQRALDAFGAGRTTEESLDQLVEEISDPYIAQFAFILRHTSESNQAEILAALQSLGRRLDQRQRLKDRSRVALALVSGTVRFLQSANGAVIALAVLAPFWWNFYASSISHQAILIIGATITLLGSWYFENQLQQLRGRVL